MVLRPIERHFPKKSRARALQKAVDFIIERLNGEDGLGAIYPAMANSVMMFDMFGDKKNLEIAFGFGAQAARDPGRRSLLPALPLADLGHRFGRARAGGSRGADVKAACDWLIPRQILDVVGDWADNTPGTRPGGWAFQYNNAHYPDVDDTAVVGMLLHRSKDPAYETSIARAREWILGHAVDATAPGARSISITTGNI